MMFFSSQRVVYQFRLLKTFVIMDGVVTMSLVWFSFSKSLQGEGATWFGRRCQILLFFYPFWKDFQDHGCAN
jgi:hypothetical protein